VAACEELASHYERQRREFSTALKYARQAIVALKKRASDGRFGRHSGIELRRFERLKKKIRRLEIRLQNATSAGPRLEKVR
jgi:hypothetical protein